MKRVILVVLSICFLGTLCGCAAVLLGGAVAGGMAVSKDTAKLETDTSFQRAWTVTYNTLLEMGEISLRDEDAGEIEAKINDSDVTAQIIRITRKSVRIEIKARKNLMPEVGLAVEIINKINRRL
ncbi:MAG: DUF3568 family protein [Candidatus Omnitrophica bacterium]|nr:DUF3568 family protein [Candidatus Omnitrophota bacterium]